MMDEIPGEFFLWINSCLGDLSGLQKRDHLCVLLSIRVRNLVNDIDLRSSLFLIPQIFERTCDSEDCSQSLLVLVAQKPRRNVSFKAYDSQHNGELSQESVGREISGDVDASVQRVCCEL
jgi:hypothetical protein